MILKKKESSFSSFFSSTHSFYLIDNVTGALQADGGATANKVDAVGGDIRFNGGTLRLQLAANGERVAQVQVAFERYIEAAPIIENNIKNFFHFVWHTALRYLHWMTISYFSYQPVPRCVTRSEKCAKFTFLPVGLYTSIAFSKPGASMYLLMKRCGYGHFVSKKVHEST